MIILQHWPKAKIKLTVIFFIYGTQYTETRISCQEMRIIMISASFYDILWAMHSTKHLREQERVLAKEQRTHLILEVGYELFLENGLVDVEMNHVAAAVQISRATLYRYFSSKQILAFAVLKHVASSQIIPKFRSERKVFVGTGHEKFAQFVAQLVDAYRLFPDFFRFSAMVDSAYTQRVPAQEQAEWYRELFAGLFMEDTPRVFLEEGQRDGSVRQDIEPHLYLATILATIPTVAEHIAINPELAQQVYDVENPSVLIEIAADALVRALIP